MRVQLGMEPRAEQGLTSPVGTPMGHIHSIKLGHKFLVLNLDSDSRFKGGVVEA